MPGKFRVRLRVIQFDERSDPHMLTDSKVRSAKPLAKSYKFTDSQGLYLTVSTSGAKLWYFHYQVKHRPDGLITLPDETAIAIETERRLKTKARYHSMVTNHLLTRTNKYWIYVFYIVPDQQKKRAIELLFNSVKHVIVDHQHIPLEARHRHVFRVYTFEELRGLALNFG
ncbi:Arm DNA-binding domain-containing protein [Dickeya dianthicola]|nr:Arm DNA-binding domain-containing protein [Dickeya dianthicola]